MSAFLSFILFISAATLNYKDINKSNWRNHPKIIEIRHLSEEIDQLITKRKLNKKVNTSTKVNRLQQQLYFDENKIVRKYIEEGGSNDSFLKFQYYYDQNQKPRFVFITGGAVNGSELEHRIYFDLNGKRIWEFHEYTKGPGYTWPSIWPKEELISNPWQAF